ncbi:hypothetical protein BKA70DRAFT_1444317 [Coprinopsis sp. MPI-PUGE-AT-0042]|nr:hypothetical protein BKA70DRAFT_1444314 [Coprinopsis sp. MPI-PUGE-AT-0042]KAH6886614.1 hypothetical protein BKA70DRAFT_1444317 [Coprinopsis sp. MPI-PUGE-AT-0042]
MSAHKPAPSSRTALPSKPSHRQHPPVAGNSKDKGKEKATRSPSPPPSAHQLFDDDNHVEIIAKPANAPPAPPVAQGFKAGKFSHPEKERCETVRNFVFEAARELNRPVSSVLEQADLILSKAQQQSMWNLTLMAAKHRPGAPSGNEYKVYAKEQFDADKEHYKGREDRWRQKVLDELERAGHEWEGFGTSETAVKNIQVVRSKLTGLTRKVATTASIDLLAMTFSSDPAAAQLDMAVSSNDALQQFCQKKKVAIRDSLVRLNSLMQTVQAGALSLDEMSLRQFLDYVIVAEDDPDEDDDGAPEFALDDPKVDWTAVAASFVPPYVPGTGGTFGEVLSRDVKRKYWKALVKISFALATGVKIIGPGFWGEFLSLCIAHKIRWINWPTAAKIPELEFNEASKLWTGNTIPATVVNTQVPAWLSNNESVPLPKAIRWTQDEASISKTSRAFLMIPLIQSINPIGSGDQVTRAQVFNCTKFTTTQWKGSKHDLDMAKAFTTKASIERAMEAVHQPCPQSPASGKLNTKAKEGRRLLGKLETTIPSSPPLPKRNVDVNMHSDNHDSAYQFSRPSDTLPRMSEPPRATSAVPPNPHASMQSLPHPVAAYPPYQPPFTSHSNHSAQPSQPQAGPSRVVDTRYADAYRQQPPYPPPMFDYGQGYYPPPPPRPMMPWAVDPRAYEHYYNMPPHQIPYHLPEKKEGL